MTGGVVIKGPWREQPARDVAGMVSKGASGKWGFESTYYWREFDTLAAAEAAARSYKSLAEKHGRA